MAQSGWRAAAETVVEGSEDWQMGNAGAATMAGGAAEDSTGAAADAKTAVGAMSPIPINWDTAVGVRPPRPADWNTMTRVQKNKWKKQGGKWRMHKRQSL